MVLHEIIDRLYIGDYMDAFNKELLLKEGITHVINLSEYGNPWSHLLIYYKIDIPDHPDADIARYFPSTFAFIEEALRSHPRHKVLVHCMAGISRSPTIVCAYMGKKFPQMGFFEILHFVKRKRPQIQPNPGFSYQLFKEKLLT